MRQIGYGCLAAVVVVALCCAGWGASDESETGNQYNSTQGFVVHEWGVLTGAAGSDAVGIFDVPSFVTWVRNQNAEMDSARKPVIHFYAPEEKELSVSIGLGGVGNYCVWPPLNARSDERGRRKISPVYEEIEWGSVKVLPPQAEKPKLRDVEKNSWWLKARDIHSNYLSVGDERERFLFYEVAGPNYPISVELKRTETGLQLVYPMALKEIDKLPENWDHPSDLANFFLVEVAGKTGKVLFSKSAVNADSGYNVLSVDWGKDQTFDLSSDDWKTATRARLQKLLEEAGLYADEAATVAAIWDKEFFHDEGARAIYFMPCATYDKLFPITLSEKPDAMKRVMMVCIKG